MSDLIHFTANGHGDPLFLVHGGLANGELAWGRTAAALAAHHRVIVVDRRGHGQSPRDPRPYTIRSDAADVFAVAEAAQLDTFHLVGHSYGGIVALEMLRQQPGRVRSMHLIEPPLLALLPQDPVVNSLLTAGARIWERAHTWDAETLATEFLAMVAGSSFVAMIKERPVWDHLVREAERIRYEEFPGHYLVDHLANLTDSVPFRLYTGGRSHPGLRRITLHLAAVLTNAQVVDIPEGYHDVQKVGEPFLQQLLQVTKSRISD